MVMIAPPQKPAAESTPVRSGGPRHRAPARRRIPWMALIASAVILLGVCVFLYPATAAWFSQLEQSRVVETARQNLDAPPNNDAEYRAEQLDLAREYNDSLASGALFEAGTRVPVGDGAGADSSLVYTDLLSTGDDGFMGRLKYDALAIDLPIYHGTSDETLARGVGHLEGTSLPVGGTGTRAVLTAHRGLPAATLFSDLDRSGVGDRFTVSVLDQVLTYEVVETQVIDPDDTEAIVADADRDLVTLVTCTPLGLNTQRILVTAERVTPTPPADIAAATAVPDLPGLPWWALGLGATVIVLGVYVWSASRPARSDRGVGRRLERGARRSATRDARTRAPRRDRGIDHEPVGAIMDG